MVTALWNFDSRMNYEISGDVERKVEADSDGISSEGYLEESVERRQKLESKHFAHHRDRIFKSKVQMHRIGEKLHISIINLSVVATNLQPILMSYHFFFTTCFGLLVGDDDTIVLLKTPIATEKGPTKRASLRAVRVRVRVMG